MIVQAAAALALAMFVRRVAAGVAAAATALERLDAIVFTAGIGETPFLSSSSTDGSYC